MSWYQTLRYRLLGPYWPEYLVAKELRNKGWKVYRHFYCFDPTKSTYAEIDVLGISKDGFILVEVKSYEGQWESLDHLAKPVWKKVRTGRIVKSPVWQVARARRAFRESLVNCMVPMDIKYLSLIRTYVFLDRGTLINAGNENIRQAWTNAEIEVVPISWRTQLPTASGPAAPRLINFLNGYKGRYEWVWYFKILNWLGMLNDHLSKKSKRWSTFRDHI